MKKQNSLKAAFIYMMIAFVCVCVCGSFVSCSKDEVTGHDNNGNATMSIKVEKRDTTPEPVFRNDTIPAFRNDSVIVIIDYYKNDTIIDTKNYGAPVTASISREFDKLQTTEARLANLDFTFGEVSSSTNGKNQVVAKQTIQDGDGQNYTGQTTSGKIFNIYAELVTFKKTSLKNTDLEPSADEAKLVNTNIAWVPVVRIVNARNLAGKEFELTTNSTEHLRYIPKNAPELIKHDDWKVWKETGNWSTVWHFECNEYWSNDSVAPKSKLATLKGSYSRKDLDDKTVSNLVDYTHPAGDLKWGNYAEIESKDAGVKLFEKKGTKKAYATNGFDADKFDTEFTITMQKADVLFCDSLFHVESDEATLTNQRNVFVDEDSDRDGYSMVRFTDTELAQWAGQYDQKLEETCKLYLKVKDPELIDVIFSNASKKHTASPNKVKVTLKGKEKYDTGAESEDIDFGFEMDEIWEAVDTFYSKQTEYIYETTDTMRADGSVVKTAQTKTVKGGTWSFNKYEGYTFVPVKIDGKEFKVRWHFVVYEDFSFTYKKYSYDKFDAASYSYKAENDKLAQNTDLTTASLEVWNYTVDGIFTIEDATRTAEGTGRLDKALEEVVINEGWDKFSFETDAHEYTDRVEYFLKWIREYNTGKKTSQEVKVVLKRNAEGSAYTITVENPQREIGSQTENSSYVSRTETSSDIVINYDWKTSVFELPNYFDGSTITKNDIATFVDPTNVKVTKKNSKGEDVEISLPSFEHQLTSTVSELEKVSESDELVEYTYTRTWSWASTQCTSTVKSIGNINTLKSTPVTPDFDIEVGKIYATVSRPSNRNGNPITAYTYLLVSKDGTKCLPIGIYKDVVTEGKIQDMHSTYNSACYVKDEDNVVPTNCYSHNGLGMMIWADKDGNPVDAETHTWLQGNRFNDRGNDYVNHTGKYAPKAEKKGNVYVVTFEGTNVSYTFKGWDVQ